MGQAVIVDSVRTGLAKSFRGGFNNTRADNIVAHIIDALIDRTGIDPALVEDVILGCGAPEGAQGHNIGRTAGVLSKLPITTGGTTVNRYCSSGLQTIAMAAAQIQAGFYDTIIAGGVESISTTQGNTNMHMYVNDELAESVPGIYHPMGVTAETVAKRYGVTREAQDEYAYASQMRTAEAQKAGRYKDEIIPMKTVMKVVDKESGAESEHEVVVDSDTCNRPATTLEGLASLQPVFDPENGSVTAGNSSQLSDGASVTLVMSEEKAAELNLKPLAVLRGFTTMGCEPDEMGIGPVFSVPKLLERNGLKIEDIDLWELNEAFASQVVYCRDKLGIPMDRLNLDGGSIAIGHPFAMTGSRQVGHLARALRDGGKRYGIVTMCVGGGMGATGLLEAC
ncbi:MAG: thiolase family protein [Gammaproteobacteria bacterium AqS3]|nr:thiolase family protein [Gammaproteobacteria bacterium AqS3]